MVRRTTSPQNADPDLDREMIRTRLQQRIERLESIRSGLFTELAILERTNNLLEAQNKVLRNQVAKLHKKYMRAKASEYIRAKL